MSAIRDVRGGAFRAAGRACLLIAFGVLGSAPARAASHFPDIPVWMNVGAWKDSSTIAGLEYRCIGSFTGPLPDSVHRQGTTLSVRFMRDRATEARPDFGGYRVYRMQNSPDSSKAVLIRRFSINPGSELTWNFSRVTKVSSVSSLINSGGGTFAPRVSLPAGVTPSAIAVGDVNKDGKPDLVVATQGTTTVTELFGDGNGGFNGRAESSVGVFASDLKLADVNNDGRLDIVVASANSRDLVVLPSNPQGGFLTPISTPVGMGPSSLALADVTLDGKLDFVVACGGSDSLYVVASTLTGTNVGFGTKSFTATGSRPSALVVGDVTGDVVPEIMVTNAGSNTMSAFRTTATSSGILFASLVTIPVGNEPSGIAMSDVNGDAKSDLVVTNGGSNTVSVLLGNGTGGFSPQPDVPTGTTPRGIVVADLNGDGQLDIAVANQGSNDVSVLNGNGTGAFTAGSVLPVGVGPRGIAVGDVNNDGKPDLFTADFSYDLPYICSNSVVNDSIVTFVDPDSNGRFIKVCRDPGVEGGRCGSVGDSIFILVKPPGPHDGFLTWYSITIEKKNTTDPDYEDLFVPDTLNNFARCTDPNDRGTCPNLNNKLRNIAGPSEPTPGPTANLEKVLAVPNPYRGSETWDQPGQSEVHFINLPSQAKIKIYTAAGDLVRELNHNDTTRDFERWDLKNGAGKAVASGIYMYRIESALFHFQSRLVVIR